MRLLLITGGLHPFNQTTPVNTKTLRDGGHTVRVTESAKELSGPAMGTYDAVILNTWRRNLFVENVDHLLLSYPWGSLNNDFTDPQRAGLKSFVQSGGGLISLHISADSSPDWPDMKKLTGGGWVSGVSKHKRFGQFTVNVSNPQHPVASGVNDFETVDEFYYNLDQQPGIDVFLGSRLNGEDHPLGWSTTYGEGKVVHLALGHSGVSVGMPLDGHASTCMCPPWPPSPFQQLLLNAVGYVKQ
jgi:type 1 glutamine amidotransferase